MEVPTAKQSHRRCDQLPILHPDAAGIDVGASELFVAVGADRDPQPVRRFPTFTRDLHALADWLQHCGVRSVAMESTSVYWIPIYPKPGCHCTSSGGTVVAPRQGLQGEFFGRICRKLGKPQAITATAHKLARIVYHLLSTREAYDESVFHKCEEEALKRAEMRLRRQAAHL